MTTTKTITVSLEADMQDETFSAEYFQIEDGWITFKTEDGKAVVAYPEKRITRIKSDDAPKQAQTFHVNAAGFSGEDARANAEAAAKIAKRWGGPGVSGMAEVLAAWDFDNEQGQGEWAMAPERVKPGWIKHAQKTLDFLTCAGFGPVKAAVEVTEAQWQEAAEMVDYEMDFGQPSPVAVPRSYTEADLREAKAVALEDAADEMEPSMMQFFKVAQDLNEPHRAWLRARAAAVRGNS